MEPTAGAPLGIGAVAYFSMEVGLNAAMPTYSGGLGVLAGDTLRAAADSNIPIVAITLLHRQGYFRQRLDSYGNQSEDPDVWSPEDTLEPLRPRISVTIEGRTVRLGAWRYQITGVGGHTVPVYFLDAALPENSEFDQSLTGNLYGGDIRYRLCQETLLGVGGVAMLRAIGHRDVATYHMNEGHSAFLAMALLDEQTQGQGVSAATQEDIGSVRNRCVFTTHTPVPAGHDWFSKDLVRQVLGDDWSKALEQSNCFVNDSLNMTYLALFFSRYINGVSMVHEEVSQDMFPNYPVNAITNGVHAGTWISPPFQDLFDRHFPEWRLDNRYLRYAVSIPLAEIQRTHAEAKRCLVDEIERRRGIRLNPSAMTLGFARRATPYKRADLLFSDPDRLSRIVNRVGPLQIVYAGKAHPMDEGGKSLIRRIYEAAESLSGIVNVVYLEDYDMALGRLICAGVDLWLNTPQMPQEASGTSGMKAALNGVPSFSILDGWWAEGHIEGVTGWSIGDHWDGGTNSAAEIASLYEKLEYLIAPTFYTRPTAYADVMRSTIALNGSFFNAQRMVSQYALNAYRS